MLAISAVVVLLLGGCATAVGRGDAALRQGRPEDAARYFEQALAADPGRLDARVGLGIARYRTCAWESASAILGAVIVEAPRRADARLYLGLAQLMRHDVAAAREHLEALRGSPVHPRLAAQLDRVIPLLVTGLDRTVRDLIAAELDDAYEWAVEVDRARRMSRAPLEPTWTILWDHPSAGTLYGPFRGQLPAAP